MAVYLADSSIWIGKRRPGAEYLRDLFAERYANDEIATCVPVALEVLVGPPNAKTYDDDWNMVWRHLHWLPLREEHTRRALEVQRQMAHTTDGAHRRRPIDYLVAVCAEAASGVVLWHWDADLTVICNRTGQPQEAEHLRARQHGIHLPPEAL